MEGNRTIRRIVYVVCLFIVFAVFSVFSFKSVSADLNTDLTNMNAGDVLTYKKAEKVRINEWKVTMDIYGKDVVTNNKVSVVLAVDVSGSMNDLVGGQTKIARAKSTAINFANNLITNGNGNVDIAIVTFNDNGHSISGFSSNLTTITNNINGIGTPSGGTNIQAGIYQARQAFINASAPGISQYLVLLSDGEPTYAQSFTSKATVVNAQVNNTASTFNLRTEVSCGFLNNSNCKKYETKDNLPYLTPGASTTLFNYANNADVGNGNNSNNVDMNERRGTAPNFSDFEYNLANNTIAEANYFKNNVDGVTHPGGVVDRNIYTVGIQASSNLADVLTKIASLPDMAFTPDIANLQNIFDDIATRISAAVSDSVVDVQLTPGFNVLSDGIAVGETTTQTQGSVTVAPNKKSLSWNVGTHLTGSVPGFSDIKHAQLVYIVEINEDILTQSSTAGEYLLANSANLSYVSADGLDLVAPFQQLQLAPLFVNVNKSFYNTEGQLISFPADAEVDATLSLASPAFSVNTILNAGKQSDIFYQMKDPGNYLVTEDMIAGDPDDDKYSNEIFINGTSTDNIDLDLTMTGTVNVDIRNTELVQTPSDGTITVSKEIEYTNQAQPELGDSDLSFNIKVCADLNCDTVIGNLNLKSGESVTLGSLEYQPYYIFEDNPGRFIKEIWTNGSVGDTVTLTDQDPNAVVEVKNIDNIPVDIPKINVNASKHWVSIENRRHPQMKIQLQRDGVDYLEPCFVGDVVGMDVTQTNCNWPNLNSEDGLGHQYQYTLVEELNNEYTTTSSNTTDNDGNINYEFTNEYTGYRDEVVNVEVEKTWFNVEPEDIAEAKAHIILKRNGVKVDNSEIEFDYVEGQTNTYTWTNLPRYSDENGTYVFNEYSIEETNPLFAFNIIYDSIIIENDTYILKLENSYRDPHNSFYYSATKQWEGGPLVKPDVTLRLYQDDKPYPEGSDCVLKNNENVCEWENVLEKDPIDQHVYEYHVEEVNVPKGYTASYSDDTFIVTNKYTKKGGTGTEEEVLPPKNEEDDDLVDTGDNSLSLASLLGALALSSIVLFSYRRKKD